MWWSYAGIRTKIVFQFCRFWWTKCKGWRKPFKILLSEVLQSPKKMRAELPHASRDTHFHLFPCFLPGKVVLIQRWWRGRLQGLFSTPKTPYAQCHVSEHLFQITPSATRTLQSQCNTHTHTHTLLTVFANRKFVITLKFLARMDRLLGGHTTQRYVGRQILLFILVDLENFVQFVLTPWYPTNITFELNTSAANRHRRSQKRRKRNQRKRKNPKVWVLFAVSAHVGHYGWTTMIFDDLITSGGVTAGTGTADDSSGFGRFNPYEMWVRWSPLILHAVRSYSYAREIYFTYS